MMAFQRRVPFGLCRATVASFTAQRPSHIIQKRLAVTKSVPEEPTHETLAKQRRNRPVSPHLSILRPQITWYASSLSRITGVTLSGSLYLFGFAYVTAPYTGLQLDTASMVSTVAAWPLAAKVTLKICLAFPMIFHSLNGVRHLMWDIGMGFSNQQVSRTGWSVVGLAVVGTAYYAFWQ